MVKTRSQSVNPTIKKEEREDKLKLEKTLHGTNNASKTKSKITKSRAPTQTQIAKVKSQNNDDNKALLASPKNIFRRSNTTAEQIAKLISYIVNDKMSVLAASRKAGISHSSALNYYHEYRDDPEHKIPLPKTGLNRRPSAVTQQKIDDLIHYIINDGMNLTYAAKKVDIDRSTAKKYYAKYLEDPERKIPLLNVRTGYSSKSYTQEQITDLISYIVCDKMPLVEASNKVSMSHNAAKRYYSRYLHDPNHGIPEPCESNPRSGKPCTNDQVKSLIGYVVNDGMTLFEASIKADMSGASGSKYYKQYLKDPEKNIPTPETNGNHATSKRATVDQVKDFFCYVIIDKLNVTQAARKAKIAISSGQRHYNKYLKSPNNQTKIKDMSYSADKMKRFIKLVQNEKMSFKKAADAAHLDRKSAMKHYKQYLKSPQYEFPENQNVQHKQEDISRLICCAEQDKMNLNSASRKTEMNPATAYKHHNEYRNDPEHRTPAPTIIGHTIKGNILDKYAQIVADIYKNNPSIKPMHENHPTDSDALDIEVKEETVEEDTKMLP